jgi:hypothetical protein
MSYRLIDELQTKAVLSHKPVDCLVLVGLDFMKPSVVQLRQCLQSERAFACHVYEQRPKLR